MNNKEIQNRLDEIKKRLEAATPGPWFPRATDDNMCMNARYVSTEPLLNEAGNHEFVHDGFLGMGLDANSDEVIAITLLQEPNLASHISGKWDKNTEFIAHSRDDIEWLLGML